jgi:hypothetical protein
VWQVCLVLPDHATTIARAYGVGTPVREMIMVARGKQGRVWRLDTDTGAFAINELVIRQLPADRGHRQPTGTEIPIPPRVSPP